MQEEYRKVKVQGLRDYSVSNFGNFRNDFNKIVFKLQTNKDGYKTVNINCIKKLLKIHKLVAEAFIENPYKRGHVDHIDNDRTNNYVNNLRWSTPSENNFNMSISKVNTSGYKGVSFDKRRNKWVASVKKNGKSYYLGGFTDIEQAIKVRQEKANELFGEFTHQSERIVNFNIKIPKNTKLNINIEIDDEAEEYKLLEQEFLEKMK
jgi:hypothetical protein